MEEDSKGEEENEPVKPITMFKSGRERSVSPVRPLRDVKTTPGSIGKLKISSEMRAKLELVTIAHSAKPTAGPAETNGRGEVVGVRKLEDNRRLMLQQQLGGVLRKEGQRWVADTRHSQGLRFNPQFLTAINQLSQLADVLFTDGGLGVSFELRGKGVRDIVDTTFILNGEKHHYFNQRERWQRFTWPGTSNHPGSRLLWTSVYTGERLFADYEGTWGLIRLLEHARITPLNDSDSQMRVQIKAPDNLELTWNLRTELGTGPLELLKLRGFELPTEVFLQEGAKPKPPMKKRKSG